MTTHESEEGPKSLFWKPQEIVIVKVWESRYFVYRSLLCKDSEYFESIFSDPTNEGHTQEANLGTEIKTRDFGLYIDILFRDHFVNNFRLSREHLPKTQPLNHTLCLWKLAQRFQNARITALATDSVEAQLSRFTMDWWNKLYNITSAEGILATIKHFERLAFKCEHDGAPFLDDILQACGNMPPQLYDKHAERLAPGFARELSKKLLKRFADPDLSQPVKRSDSATPTQDGISPASAESVVIELDD